MTQAYVLFDRDGTLIKHVHYLVDPSKVELLANSALGLKMLKNFGFRFGIITNQSVINRGLATEDQVNAVNNRVIELFQFEGIDFDFILYCPHTPDEVCDCRKPAVALGQQAINEYDIDPTISFMLGDQPSDVIFGLQLGFRSIKIGDEMHNEPQADFHAKDLLEAAHWITSNTQKGQVFK